MKLLIAILVFFFLILQYRLWIGEGSLPEVWQLETKLEQQRLENSALRARNEILEAEVQDLKQGLDALEERARNDLGMIKEGEVFYQVIDDKDKKKIESHSQDRIQR